ncbi:hypothetical protein TH61_04560 [Rufibacter sp. DG15C]|uniref:hypothetical protein n=1 Tax=Rufibacter sp. DG15C TaxID=1379909 RepID=UPI00078DA3BF|nr:hypothetical protein [Rufibacter sp. DG15C]AMM50594.1 hypothetical protein TH61_04560 [Rufibacter sp. DG15C]
MAQEEKKDQNLNLDDKLPRGKSSQQDMKQNKNQEPGAGAKGNASFQQGGKQPGNSQGGQGGKSTDRDANSRHDTDNEQSVFGRLDS